ncbi:CDGSH iron-sulfur domain-containing protein 3, mitochondrial-like isoform X1 [Stegodyphus dumicola]|uniref:CDGSH iron-sulfur domain-containing protein 3, mitochondrial-like isoform X1 n=1 Tax=Stegodyphus dumicola TaxID=202533 RepID=UPI0015B33605|nr:CDGSH iron-sulfur domain-containing protein 3, mitochondrial-like isoform X1 [Stegodyphus dumicola]
MFTRFSFHSFSSLLARSRNLLGLGRISTDGIKILCQYSSRKRADVSDIPELNEPPLKKFYEAYYQPDKGRVHDKKPFKIKCEKGKLYYWCICGWSHDQPLCDGRCKFPEMKIKLKPVLFKPKQTREYWFCNCKQTKNRPFCDGSHNSAFVQAASSVIRR